MSSINNVHLDAVEHGDSIVFMHAVKQGPANQSYGLQVAKLAGVPPETIEQARKKLLELEKQSSSSHEQFIEEKTGQMGLFDYNLHPVVEQLQQLDIDNLTPKQALDLIFELAEKARH